MDAPAHCVVVVALAHNATEKQATHGAWTGACTRAFSVDDARSTSSQTRESRFSPRPEDLD